MSTTIIFTVASLSVLGLLLAVVLYFVAQKFKVEEDPRIDIVEAIMPGANCGGCGQAGCRAFAEACTKADNLDSLFCPVGGNATMKKIADALGFEVTEKAPMVAVVRCNGTCENRPKTNVYDGAVSCAVKAALYSGDTGCKYGCVGCGDCVKACNFDALSMDPATGLPVVDEEKCAACGACVKACPKAFLATAPLSWLTQETNTLLPLGPLFLSSMTDLGQVFAHAPQPVHFSSSTTGRPVTGSIDNAPKLQTLTQSPQPTQPNLHPVSPEYKADFAAQVAIPS